MGKLIIGFIVMIAMMGIAAAGPVPTVAGWVFDHDGKTVADATVIAYSGGYPTDGGTEIGSALTGSDGYYSIELGTMTTGQEVFVVANKNGLVGENSGILDEIGAFVQVSLNIYFTPEFPTIALPVAAILGLIFIFQRRREEM